MGISSWNNIFEHFCERILYYLAYKHGHICCLINVNNNILPTVTDDLVRDNVLGVPNETHVMQCLVACIFRLLCIALWHYVCEHVIYTVYSDCVLVFAFSFLS